MDITAQKAAAARGTISVFLVDDQSVFLWGLEHLIKREHPRLVNAGTASSAQEAEALMPAANPHVVLLDLELGGHNSVDVLRRLLLRSDAKVLALTNNMDGEHVEAAILAGASGVIPKTAHPSSIVKAIDKVCQGELWADRATVQRLIRALSDESKRAHAGQEKPDRLSLRECEIVATLSNTPNKPLKWIAGTLQICESTLRNHLTSIYQKLGVSGRLELYLYAAKHGLNEIKDT